MTAARLGEAWPEVSERLGRLLARRGVDPVLAQDIVQDVAVRALDKQVPFTDPDDLYRWAAVAARNIHVDHLRSGGRTTEVEALVGVPDDTDVAYAVEHRVALGVVWRALAVMRPGEREAILESLDERAAARTSGALVRRHRARATLKKAVGGLIAAAGAVRAKVRVVSPMVRTVGAIAVLSPVVVLNLATGSAGGLGGAGREVQLGTTPLVSVANVANDPVDAVDARVAATAGSAGAARPESGSTRTPGAAGAVSTTKTDTNLSVAGPKGTGAQKTEEPQTEDDSLVCLTDVPVIDRDVCTGHVSRSRL